MSKISFCRTILFFTFVCSFLSLCISVQAQESDFLTQFKKQHEVHQVGDLGVFFLPDSKDYVQSYLREGKIWEEEHQKVFEKHIRSGDTVIDAGAYVGSHTVKLAKLAYPGIVHAFEPQADIVEVLKTNIKLNGLDNVKVYPYALGDKECATNIIVSESNKGASPISGCSDKSESGLQIKTLDGFQFEKVDFMKIDVEGFEGPVLRGARELIKNNKPIMVIEVGVRNQPEFLPYCRSLGYDLTEFRHQEFLALPVSAK